MMPDQPRPTMIANFAITYRCNSRCSTCGIWAMRDRSGEELTLGEIRRFFEAEKDFLSNVKSIQLTGGEPFLRGDVADIAEAVWHGVPRAFIWVATKGLLPEVIQSKTCEMLEMAGRGGVGVTVSIDGLEQIHDEQRGVEGAYERAFETLNRLAKLREKHPEMRLSVGMTITPHNQHQIKKAITTAEYHGADFTVRPANVSDVYYRNSEAVGEWDFDALASGLDAVANHFTRRRGTLRAASVLSYLNRIPGYIATRARHLPCSAGTSSMFIDPTGEIHPCLFVEDSFGNLREGSIEGMWLSLRGEESRKSIVEGRCPGCFVECEVMRDIRRDRMGLASAVMRGLGYELRSRLSRSS